MMMRDFMTFFPLSLLLSTSCSSCCGAGRFPLYYLHVGNTERGQNFTALAERKIKAARLWEKNI